MDARLHLSSPTEIREERLGVEQQELTGWVIRVGIVLHDFFMGESREGYIDTRVIESRLQLRFSGPKTAVFKSVMPFEGDVYVMYDDNQAVAIDKLELASITLRPVVTTSNGGLRTLPEIVVPRRGNNLSSESRRPGRDYRNEYIEWMERQAEDAEYAQFRSSVVYHFRIPQIPKDATSMRITAQYSDDQGDTTSAELQSVAFYSPPASSGRGGDFHVHISTSTRQGAVSENAIFHLRANFAFNSFCFSSSFQGSAGARRTTDSSARRPTRHLLRPRLNRDGPHIKTGGQHSQSRR